MSDIPKPMRVNGLALRASQETAGTYNTTEILGYKITKVGSADSWVATFVEGGVETIAFGDAVKGVYPDHLVSLVIPADGQATVYIPTAETGL